MGNPGIKSRRFSPEDHLAGFLCASLGEYFRIASNRYLTYLLATLIAGGWTYFGLTLPHLTEPWSGFEIFRWTHTIIYSEMFRWTYTAETALNFGLSYYVFGEWLSRGTGAWGRFENRTVGKALLIWTVAFLFAFMLQLTFIYSRVDVYYPRLIHFLDVYPAVRPRTIYVFLFFCPCWIIIGCVLTWIGLRGQFAVDQERSKIDRLLDLREQKWATKYQALKTNAVISSTDPERKNGFEHPPLQVSDRNGSRWINPEQISHISVEDHYSRLFIKDHQGEKEMLIKRPLKTLLSQLPEGLFLQIHRSHVINLSYISKIKKSGRSYTLFLEKGAHALPVSRYRLPRILPYLQEYLSPASGLIPSRSERLPQSD